MLSSLVNLIQSIPQTLNWYLPPRLFLNIRFLYVTLYLYYIESTQFKLPKRKPETPQQIHSPLSLPVSSDDNSNSYSLSSLIR